ncbi:unnamed protein product [Nesidiocoris tenuis]|uniref:Uncharacterized protein n=1 Tax=Nesidiocoris tenuis TaxID=355587 RepID=A0A6H5GQ92_9HEMI|nr:unnamed protein product [Nesidiocoris tenuis]
MKICRGKRGGVNLDICPRGPFGILAGVRGRRKKEYKREKETEEKTCRVEEMRTARYFCRVPGLFHDLGWSGMCSKRRQNDLPGIHLYPLVWLICGYHPQSYQKRRPTAYLNSEKIMTMLPYCGAQFVVAAVKIRSNHATILRIKIWKYCVLRIHQSKRFKSNDRENLWKESDGWRATASRYAQAQPFGLVTFNMYKHQMRGRPLCDTTTTKIITLDNSKTTKQTARETNKTAPPRTRSTTTMKKPPSISAPPPLAAEVLRPRSLLSQADPLRSFNLNTCWLGDFYWSCTGNFCRLWWVVACTLVKMRWEGSGTLKFFKNPLVPLCPVSHCAPPPPYCYPTHSIKYLPKILPFGTAQEPAQINRFITEQCKFN